MLHHEKKSPKGNGLGPAEPTEQVPAETPPPLSPPPAKKAKLVDSDGDPADDLGGGTAPSEKSVDDNGTLEVEEKVDVTDKEPSAAKAQDEPGDEKTVTPTEADVLEEKKTEEKKDAKPEAVEETVAVEEKDKPVETNDVHEEGLVNIENI